MKFDTIGKNHKKQILVGVGVFCVLVSVVAFTTTRAKYKSTQNVKLADGIVNYKSPDLELVAIKVSEDGENYTSSLTVPTEDYVFNEEKSKCRIPNETSVGESAPADNGVSITYTDGKINIYGMTTRPTKCYVYFDKKQIPSSEVTLAKLNITNIKEGTPDFTVVATGAETEANNGIFQTDDPMYTTADNPNPKTYYWRGAATTNHVIFANKCWRIVRINGDGTIRLIFNGTVSSGKCTGNGVANATSIAKTSVTYNAAGLSSYVGWTYNLGYQRPSTAVPQISGTASNIKTETESWFNDNSNFTDVQRAQVVEGRFCNDRRTKDNATWVQSGPTTQRYAAYARIAEGTKTPSLDCADGDIYHLKAGAITADEVQFAGASAETTNKQYYLYNGQYYWTMSPIMWNGSKAFVFFVDRDSGSLGGGADVSWNGVGLRPAINLNANTTFVAGGNGTSDNPYVVVE